MSGQTDPLVYQYFQEIENSTGLPSQTERELARRIQSGDEAALGDLVRANLRFVVKVAREYQDVGLPFADLIGAGNLGLVNAARRFDGSKGCRFITYAVWWIRQSVKLALSEQSRTVRLPINRVTDLYRIGTAISKLEQKLGHPPILSDIADEAALPTRDLEMLLDVAQRPVSLEKLLDGPESNRCLRDLIPDGSIPSSDDLVSRKELEEKVRCAVNGLPQVQARVISMYFGLSDQEPQTLAQIAVHFGRSRERIRQIKEKALHALRRSLETRPLRQAQADS